MFFKRKKDEDVDDIREAISGSSMPSMSTMPGMPEAPEYYEKPREDFAPLFVKVEKYREALAAIAEIKMFISGLKQLFAVINELEALRSDANKIMRATIQRLEKSIIEIDTELLRPKGFEMDFPTGEIEVHQIEDSLTELQKQIASLKRELESMR